MVKANICLEGEANRIINFLKTTMEFKDKSEVINYIILEYADKILNEDKFKEEFILSVLKNRSGDPSDRIDITDKSSRLKLLGLEE